MAGTGTNSKSSTQSHISRDDLLRIEEGISVAAKVFAAIHGADLEELRVYFTRYIKERDWILPLVDEVREHPSFHELVSLGCGRDDLALLLCLTIEVPRRSTPRWDSLMPVNRQRYLEYMKSIGKVACDIQLLISRGGLELVPPDLTADLDKLPDLLIRYAEVVPHIHSATDERSIVGPGGLDAEALLQLASYVRSRAHRPCNKQVVDLLATISGKEVSERAYRRFVSRHVRDDKTAT